MTKKKQHIAQHLLCPVNVTATATSNLPFTTIQQLTTATNCTRPYCKCGKFLQGAKAFREIPDDSYTHVH